MRAFAHPDQRLHEPVHFVAFGVARESPEQSARIDRLEAGARAAGCAFETPEDQGLAPIAEVHGAEYLAFLRDAHARWRRIEGAGPEVVPNVHPDRRRASYPKSVTGQAGFHQSDTACPIGPDTWRSAYWSAQTALAATASVLADGAPAYALCRPPGHHASVDQAGGFCFFNNAAIAAQWARARGRRPAILDVDVHHGNGTQSIFYARGDVFTASIHADPARFYPFFWGCAHERGEGEGEGANFNLPLARGSDDAVFLAALAEALDRIELFGADLLVIALGLDAHERDPFQGLAVTTPGFRAIGRAIAQRGLPTALIQEGGYLSDDLADNLEAALRGVMD